MRNYRVSHQTLSINKIDFENNWVCGYTEIIIWPLDPSMVTIHLNAKQIRIHSTKLITLQNDTSIVYSDLAMSYHDPFMAVSKRSDYNYFNLENFIKLHSSAAKRVDLDEGIGELSLQIPRDFWHYVSEFKPLKLTVEFSLYRPKAGLYFVKPSHNPSDTVSGLHLFTSVLGNMSRLWFPCVDASEPCTWKIEITVSEDMVAISSGVLLDTVYTPDLHSKVYHYYLKQPVPAYNIGMVVGDFEIYPDPVIPNFTHFCLPKLMPLLKSTVEIIPNIFKFVEDKLNFNYPFEMYKTVFVDSALQNFVSYASFTIFSVYLLHPLYVLDQAVESVQILAQAIPEQFFGQFTVMRAWPDIWVPWGIAGYLGRLYIKKLMGINEYRFLIYNEMMEVVSYEEQNGGIVLDPVACQNPTKYSFSLYFAQASNVSYMCMYKKKAALIMRLLELKLGPTLILKVFRKLLLLASMTENSTIDPNCNLAEPIADRSNLLLCSDLLIYAVDLVSGLQITNFLDQWVNKSGHVRIQADYQFNRRRNVVELNIKQLCGRIRGCCEYIGPLEVATQEYEGYFRQTVRIERPPGQSRFTVDVLLHSKVRKHRRRKVCLANGVEADIDMPGNATASSAVGGTSSSLANSSNIGGGDTGVSTSITSSDIPYLWLTLDSQLSLFGRVELAQAPSAALHLLRLDPDALSQARAVSEIVAARDPAHLGALRDTILNSRLFYRVRIQAAVGLRHLMNSTHQVNQGGLRDAITALYYTKTDKSLVRSNDFRNLSAYRLQISLIRQLALLQTTHGLCPNDVPHILHGLLLYNENASNRFSDHYYRSEILFAMGDAIRMGVFHRGDSSLECMPPEVRSILKDVLRCLTLDQAVPSFNFIITQPCLTILRRLQQFGYIVDEPGIFYPYVSDNNVPDVRSTAIQCLLSAVDGIKHFQVLEWLLTNVILDDNFIPVRLRLETVNTLTEKVRNGGSTGYNNVGNSFTVRGGATEGLGGPMFTSASINSQQQPQQDVYRLYWSQMLPQLHRYMECQAASGWSMRGAVLQLVRVISELGMPNSGIGSGVGGNSMHQDDTDIIMLSGSGATATGGSAQHQQQQQHQHKLSMFTSNVSNSVNHQSNEMVRLSDDSDDDMN